MIQRLPKGLAGKDFTYQQAKKFGVTQYYLQKLIDSGDVQRVSRGFYTATVQDLSDEQRYKIATKRVGGPSSICLLSALSYYDLTDIISKQIWLMVPKEKRIKSSSIKLYRTRDPRWKIGVISGNGYSITSIERTIVDALTLKTMISTKLGIEALKIALTKKKTTLSKILKMASDLGVKHRVLPYIETLS